jgi:hypothetical protein
MVATTIPIVVMRMISGMVTLSDTSKAGYSEVSNAMNRASRASGRRKSNTETRYGTCKTNRPYSAGGNRLRPKPP